MPTTGEPGVGGDLVAWIFHSPRRLVLVAGVVLLAALGVGGLLSRLSGAGAAGGPVATASPTATPTAETTGRPSPAGTAAATPTPVTGVSGAQAPDAAPFVTAAVRFTQVWGRLQPGETAAQWHDRVDPLATPELAAALRLTDPASLPGAAPTGRAVVRYLAETSALVAVPLTDGSTVLVTVVAQGGRWQVSDVQPDVGDAGDVGGSQATASATGPVPAPSGSRATATGSAAPSRSTAGATP